MDSRQRLAAARERARILALRGDAIGRWVLGLIERAALAVGR
jgi:hypothetical protein